MKHVMNKPNKLLSLALALGMSAALLAGCGQQSAQSAQSDSASASSAVSGSQSAQDGEKVRVGVEARVQGRFIGFARCGREVDDNKDELCER